MSPVVLIGPAGTGKSTVGQLVATLSGRSFVDIDGVGDRFYERARQPVDQLVRRIESHGFAAAHHWWQPARLAAVAAIDEYPSSVIAFGAGHSHFEDDSCAQQAAQVFDGAFVVLLLPSPDPAERLRCFERDACSTRTPTGSEMAGTTSSSGRHPIRTCDLPPS
jgi:shikimate kinase